MLRSSLFSASALALLCVTASAQEALTPKRITAPVKNGGTYSLATGTWSRSNPSASFNSDVLYNNQAPSGYFFGSTSVWDGVDHGRIPSTSSIPIVGTSDVYTVDCYQFGYCSNSPTGIDQITIFLDNYQPCSDVDAPGVNAVAGFIGNGLPAGTPTGGQGCWIIAFDLANTTVTFTLNGDATGSWDNDTNTDSFGWLGSYPQASGGNGTGPIIAGNCAGGGAISIPPAGEGTKFAGSPGATNATGLGTNDFFWIDANDGGVLTPNANGGCFFFGGCNTQTGPGANPWASYWMQMFGTDGADGIGTKYCSSRINESGGRAILTTEGTNPNTDLVFVSTPVPNTTGQFFYGPMMLGGALNLGDGLRCVGGMTTRLLPFINAGMMMQLPNTATFTVNYTAPYAAGLTGNQNFQHWFRSGTAAGTGSNTSDAVSIDF